MAPTFNSLHVAITGSSGLIGSALTRFLVAGGHRVTRLVRGHSDPAAGLLHWDPETGVSDAAGLEGVNAVVHLAGENIAGGRWTAARKARIRGSRDQGTRVLCEALARLARRPTVLASASGIAFYGDCGDRVVDEGGPPGEGFLAETCRLWEEATEPANGAGIRVVRTRIGIVLSPQGGALARMLPLFRLGLGGRLGNGGQYWSWISLDDAVGGLGHVLQHASLSGAVNLVGPAPVTNREFTAALARALGRPAILPVPACALRLALGQMAKETLLLSTRVLPQRLEESGYKFRHSTLAPALGCLLELPNQQA
jgi:uncharacterized protein